MSVTRDIKDKSGKSCITQQTRVTLKEKEQERLHELMVTRDIEGKEQEELA